MVPSEQQRSPILNAATSSTKHQKLEDGGSESLETVFLFFGVLLICLIVGGLVYRRKKNRTRESSSSKKSSEPFEVSEFSRLAIEHSRDGLVIIDEQLTIVLVNDVYCRMTGRSKEECIGLRPPFPGVPPEDSEIWEERVTKMFRGEYAIIEASVVKKDGSRFPALFSLGGIGTRQGKNYYIAIVKDITDYKMAEKALHESEAKFKAQYKNLPIPVYTWKKKDDDFILADYNDAANRITHGHIARFLGVTASEMHDDNPVILDELQQCFIEKRSLCRDMVYHFKSTNETKNLSVIYVFVPPDYVLVHTTDLTARIETEEKLKQSEERFRIVIESLPFHFFMIDESGRYIMQNTALRDQWGVDIIGKRPEDIGADEDTLAIWKENNRRAFEGEVVQGERSFRIRGEERTFYNIISPVYDGGTVQGILGINIDVTDRKHAELALRESDMRLRHMVDQLPAVLWSVDRDLRFTSMTGVPLSATDLEPEEIVGTTLYEYFGTDDPDYLPIAMHRKALEGESTKFEMEWDQLFWEMHTEPLRDEKRNIVGSLAIGHDVTERKRAEEQTIQSREQLRALAGRIHQVREEESTRIAREIHDELGQVLTGLRWDLSRVGKQVGGIEHIDESSQFEETIKDMIRTLDATIQRVREISSQLRPAILDDLGLVGAIEWQTQKFQTQTGIHCEINRFGIEDEDVNLDSLRSTAAFRIFQEILANVRWHAEASRVWIDLRKENGGFGFEVRDNGKGMIFENSKPLGSLGILGMRERALVFGGTVSIQSDLGKGTCVRVVIPGEWDNS
jgi:PAS domain S-box-containing protein